MLQLFSRLRDASHMMVSLVNKITKVTEKEKKETSSLWEQEMIVFFVLNECRRPEAWCLRLEVKDETWGMKMLVRVKRRTKQHNNQKQEKEKGKDV